MPPIDLSSDELDILVTYARQKFASECWPFSAQMRPVREVLDKLKPPKQPAPPAKVYAPPRATAKQRRGRDPRVSA
jgi:hypothetical protein